MGLRAPEGRPKVKSRPQVKQGPNANANGTRPRPAGNSQPVTPAPRYLCPLPAGFRRVLSRHPVLLPGLQHQLPPRQVPPTLAVVVHLEVGVGGREGCEPGLVQRPASAGIVGQEPHHAVVEDLGGAPLAFPVGAKVSLSLKLLQMCNTQTLFHQKIESTDKEIIQKQIQGGKRVTSLPAEIQERLEEFKMPVEFEETSLMAKTEETI